MENITPELFDYSVKTILSEPQLDLVTDTLPQEGIVFAVSISPDNLTSGADSAAQCIQILLPRGAALGALCPGVSSDGQLTAAEVASIKKYLINPVEAREASLEPL